MHPYRYPRPSTRDRKSMYHKENNRSYYRTHADLESLDLDQAPAVLEVDVIGCDIEAVLAI